MFFILLPFINLIVIKSRENIWSSLYWKYRNIYFGVNRTQNIFVAIIKNRINIWYTIIVTRRSDKVKRQSHITNLCFYLKKYYYY